MRRLALVLLLLPAIALHAQRLPDTVTPHHYILKLTPDLKAAKFTGEETIHCTVNRPTKQVTLNSVEIEYQSVTLQALPGGTVQTARVSLDAEKEQATFTVEQELPAGAGLEIKVAYTGVLNDKLRGFYLARTDRRNYATTQLEPTDARRMFPSWDEPAYKAPFNLAVVADQGDTAISNAPIEKDEPGPAPGKHTITFAMTPKMSTYLVALAVGDFKCLEGGADGTPIRICATPDKAQLGKFALESAENILQFYNRYYGVKYPFKKLDVVAVPDFEAGAMENTAAIFYRETLLLIPDDASVGSRRAVADVLAHEMAHQWFGDLVTMQWWDDIWLNEGFATWMTSKPVAAWKPEWNPQLDDVQASADAMSTDSLIATRPIRQSASTPSEINELFDAIAYEKTAAVLRMLEAYIGEEKFREGINLYIREHSYGNATAEDFWGAITRASGKPADKIMAGFVTQPGVPLVTVKAACRGGNTAATLAQQRYSYDRKAFEAGFPQQWQIPVCLRAAGSQAAPKCELLTEKSRTVELEGCSGFVNANADARGYYRVGYEPEAVRKIAGAVTQLSPGERIALLNDEWSQVRVGRHPIGDYMALAAGFRDERTRAVMQALTGRLEYIAEYLVNDADRGPYQQWVRALLAPAAKELGWHAAAGEADERRALRQSVIHALGYAGRDPETLRQARAEVQKVLAGASQLDGGMVNTAVNLAALAGDAALFDQYLAQMKKAKSPEEYYRFLYALTSFTDPPLIERALALLLAPEMRNQDAPGYLGALLATPESRAQAWQFTKSHWDELQRHMTTWGGSSVVSAAGAFCDASARADVQQFFTSHRVAASERGLKQALERIDYCVDLRAQQEGRLAAWLGQHGRSQAAGSAR